MKYGLLINALVSLVLGFNCTLACADIDSKMGPIPEKGTLDIHASLLYLQPTNNDLKYAVFVFNTQPYDQDWAYQVLNSPYVPAFEIGGDYAFANSAYHVSLDWMHLSSTNSASKQANPAVTLSTVQFVAPPYDVGPAVFGIKHVDSSVSFKFDNVGLHAARAFEFDNGTLQTKLFTGINLLNIKQTVTTRFSDYPGALPTSVTYGTLPDPSYSFQTANKSEYLGAGPDFGIDVLYRMNYGFSMVTQAQGLLTVGRIRSSDQFTSTSARLMEVGIPLSQQLLSSPDMTQVVPGFDAKLGLAYQFTSINLPNLAIEAGYCVAVYMNAISNLNPSNLVQVGTNNGTPEFATGTMAIQSTDSRQSTLSFNGPYVDLKLQMMS